MTHIANAHDHAWFQQLQQQHPSPGSPGFTAYPAAAHYVPLQPPVFTQQSLKQPQPFKQPARLANANANARATARPIPTTSSLSPGSPTTATGSPATASHSSQARAAAVRAATTAPARDATVTTPDGMTLTLAVNMLDPMPSLPDDDVDTICAYLAQLDRDGAALRHELTLADVRGALAAAAVFTPETCLAVTYPDDPTRRQPCGARAQTPHAGVLAASEGALVVPCCGRHAKVAQPSFRLPVLSDVTVHQVATGHTRQGSLFVYVLLTAADLHSYCRQDHSPLLVTRHTPLAPTAGHQHQQQQRQADAAHRHHQLRHQLEAEAAAHERELAAQAREDERAVREAEANLARHHAWVAEREAADARLARQQQAAAATQAQQRAELARLRATNANAGPGMITRALNYLRPRATHPTATAARPTVLDTDAQDGHESPSTVAASEVSDAYEAYEARSDVANLGEFDDDHEELDLAAFDNNDDAETIIFPAPGAAAAAAAPALALAPAPALTLAPAPTAAAAANDADVLAHTLTTAADTADAGLVSTWLQATGQAPADLATTKTGLPRCCARAASTGLRCQLAAHHSRVRADRPWVGVCSRHATAALMPGAACWPAGLTRTAFEAQHAQALAQAAALPRTPTPARRTVAVEPLAPARPRPATPPHRAAAAAAATRRRAAVREPVARNDDDDEDEAETGEQPTAQETRRASTRTRRRPDYYQ